MAEIIFATPETIVQPVGSLILEPRSEKDHILGAYDPKGMGKVVLEGGHWAPFAPAVEIQRVSDGDTYGCTCFSDNNIDEFIHKCKYNEEIDISDMFVTVGSGTIRGRGNSMKAAPEFKRKNGLLFEAEYPYSRTMTLDEFYKTLTPDLFVKAKLKLDLYDTGYLFTNGTGQQSLLDALQVSPLKVAIEGRYVFDAQGRLKNSGTDYNHAVVVFDYVLDANGSVVEWWLFDSESQQFVKARGDYAFLSPMVKFLEKKTLAPMFIKLAGHNALFSPSPTEVGQSGKPALIPYEDGDVYKLVNQTTSYQNIKTYETLEDLSKDYDFGTWIASKQPWDFQSFVNSLSK